MAAFESRGLNLRLAEVALKDKFWCCFESKTTRGGSIESKIDRWSAWIPRPNLLETEGCWVVVNLRRAALKDKFWRSLESKTTRGGSKIAWVA
ncbi:hypothetical protein M8J77_013284 [Diaphorina citri]|nr:hypothetical protein M8J77_013284 [Diaphorina citri]